MFKIIDNEEVVCDNCGSIYGLSNLKFVKANYYDPELTQNEITRYMIESGIFKSSSPRESVYSCPICGSVHITTERRKNMRF